MPCQIPNSIASSNVRTATPVSVPQKTISSRLIIGKQLTTRCLITGANYRIVISPTSQSKNGIDTRRLIKGKMSKKKQIGQKRFSLVFRGDENLMVMVMVMATALKKADKSYSPSCSGVPFNPGGRSCLYRRSDQHLVRLSCVDWIMDLVDRIVRRRFKYQELDLCNDPGRICICRIGRSGFLAINRGRVSFEDFFRLSDIHWNFGTVMEFRPQLRNWQASIRDALLESNVTLYNGFNLDHVISTKIGGSTFDGFGRRHTAADRPSNVRVALHASVERILFNTLDSTSPPLTPPSSGFASKRKPVAVGVSYRDRMGKRHHAMVRGRGEVILCAGAIGSPQLLLLSRIGTDAGTSPPRSVFLHAPGSSSLYLTVATIMEKIVGSLSYGSLRLASRDVRVSPLIRFNYFSNAEDLGRCVHGMRKIGELLRGRSLEEFKFQEWFGGRDFRFVGTTLPLNQSDDQLMEDFCRRTVLTIWHYHVRCIVRKVVESDHSVIGVDSLRIVNNPQATVVMMMGTGRYVGRKDSGRKKTKSAQKIAIHGTDSGLVSLAV